MTAIVKAKTTKIAVDPWGRTYKAGRNQLLIVGECYLAVNKRIVHMMLPQDIIESNTMDYQMPGDVEGFDTIDYTYSS